MNRAKQHRAMYGTCRLLNATCALKAALNIRQCTVVGLKHLGFTERGGADGIHFSPIKLDRVL